MSEIEAQRLTIEGLRDDLATLTAQRDRLARLLRETSNALRDDEHTYLPDRIDAALAELERKP